MQKKLFFLFLSIGVQASLYCADDDGMSQNIKLSIKRRHSDPSYMTSGDRQRSPGKFGGAHGKRSYGATQPVIDPRAESSDEDLSPTLNYFNTVLRDLREHDLLLVKQIGLFARLAKDKADLRNEKDQLKVSIYSLKHRENGLKLELRYLKTNIYSLIREAQKKVIHSPVASDDSGSE